MAAAIVMWAGAAMAKPAATPVRPVPPPALAAPAAPAVPVATEPVKSIGYLTGTQLGARCTDGSTAGVTYCYAFITGVHDTMQAYQRWLGQKEFCPGESVAQGELRQNFLAYLNAYPKSGQGQAASVVVVALKSSYPCVK